MTDPVTLASVLAGSASIVVSAAAVGTYRGVLRLIKLTEQNRRDLRGAEPEDSGLVHQVRDHERALIQHGLLYDNDPDAEAEREALDSRRANT